MVRRKTKATPGTAVVNYEEKMAAIAQQETSREAAVGNAISIRNSKFTYQGGEIGKELDVVVLDFSFINAYYKGVFDPDQPSPPDCFALSHDGKDMAPDPELVPDIQGDDNGKCEGCWANEWGSDVRGKGKACKNTRRVAVISAGENWHKELRDPEIAFISIPPTSLKGWRGYINKLAQGMKKPAFAFVTRMTFDPAAEYPLLKFEAKEMVPVDVIGRLMELRDEIHNTLMAPFDTSGYDPDKKTPAKAKGRNKAAVGKKVTAKKKAVVKKKPRGSRFA